jgi:hypothetical protein
LRSDDLAAGVDQLYVKLDGHVIGRERAQRGL